MVLIDHHPSFALFACIRLPRPVPPPNPWIDPWEGAPELPHDFFLSTIVAYCWNCFYIITELLRQGKICSYRYKIIIPRAGWSGEILTNLFF
jgi:hypothetical protein